MRLDRLFSTIKTITAASPGLVAWTAAAAALGVAGGLLCGTLYGTIDAVLHGQADRAFSAGPYFALCGAIAGALTGAFAATTDVCGSHTAAIRVGRNTRSGTAQGTNSRNGRGPTRAYRFLDASRK